MRYLLTLLCFLSFLRLAAQEEVDEWDSWFMQSVKVNVDGGEDWRYSFDLQWRAKNNSRTLDRVLLEGAYYYSPNKKWDIVPDLRVSKEHTEIEYRPGLGVVRKMYWGTDGVMRNSLSHQIKYQADINPAGVQHGLRYILFYNYVVNPKFFVGGVAGGFYRWSDAFNGIQFVRTGFSGSYVFNEYNTVTLLNAIGFENRGDQWTYSYNLLLGLTIRIKNDYKFREPEIFSF